MNIKEVINSQRVPGRFSLCLGDCYALDQQLFSSSLVSVGITGSVILNGFTPIVV